MYLYYIKIEFNIKFVKSCIVDANLLFILRSMFGKNLRSMCCISKRTVCSECQFCRTCVYAFLFETILVQENSILPGRNRGSHPFSLSSKKQFKNSRNLDEYSFMITLFGKAVDYLPYIYVAFVRSGQNGFFKNRTQFEIERVFVHGKNILIDENHLDLDFKSDEWKFGFEKSNPNAENEKQRVIARSDATKQSQKNLLTNEIASYSTRNNGDVSKILINLKSPLRFKVKGKYTADFSAEDFMNCLFRRAKTLCSLYGEISEAEKNLWKISADGIQITERNLRWAEERHYSARQKTAMRLGGVSGTFKMEENYVKNFLSSKSRAYAEPNRRIT